MFSQRRRARKTAAGTHHGQMAPPPWMKPLPTGPVVFDPSLRRAGELVRHVPVATAPEPPTELGRGAASERPVAPEPPLLPRGHAA